MNGSNIELLCRIPFEFRTRGDISVIDLLFESGYPQHSETVTERVIEEYLRAHPELVETWLGYSEDQRFTPAYYLEISQDVSYIVAYMHYGGVSSSVEQFPDRFSACACFIKHTAEKWRT